MVKSDGARREAKLNFMVGEMPVERQKDSLRKMTRPERVDFGVNYCGEDREKIAKLSDEELNKLLIKHIERDRTLLPRYLMDHPDVFQRIEPDLYQKYYEEFIKQQEKKQQQEAVAIITTERIMAERERIADEMRRKIEEEFLAKREKKEEEKPEEKTA